MARVRAVVCLFRTKSYHSITKKSPATILIRKKPYVSIRRSRDIPEVYGLRRYLRVSGVVSFFVQHSIIDFSQSMGENDVELVFFKTFCRALSIYVSNTALNSQVCSSISNMGNL